MSSLFIIHSNLNTPRRVSLVDPKDLMFSLINGGPNVSHYNSLHRIFQPFTTYTDTIYNAPTLYQEAFIGDLLNPYKESHDLNDVSNGNELRNNSNIPISSLTLKPVGLRNPLVLVGWGYDKFGRPAPSQFGSLYADLSGINPNRNYEDVKFIGNSDHGSAVNENSFLAGPLDVRWDQREGVWTTDHKFLAVIVGNKLIRSIEYGDRVIPVEWQYAWKEIKLNAHTPETPIYPASGSTIQNFAMNLNERNVDLRFIDDEWKIIYNPGVNVLGSAYPSGFSPQPISSGSIVEMFVGRGYLNLGYSFIYANAHDGIC